MTSSDLKGGTRGVIFQGVLLNNGRIVLFRTTKFDGITQGEGRFSTGSAMSLPQEGEAQAQPNLGVSFCLCIHRLSQNYQI